MIKVAKEQRQSEITLHVWSHLDCAKSEFFVFVSTVPRKKHNLNGRVEARQAVESRARWRHHVEPIAGKYEKYYARESGEKYERVSGVL